MSHSVPMSPLSILFVFGEIERGTTLQRAGLELVARLRERGFTVLASRSASDGVAAIRSDPLIGAVLVDSELDESGGAAAVLSAIARRPSC